MKIGLGTFALWAIPSAVWVTFAAIHGRLAFEGAGWREAVMLGPPILLGVAILAVQWMLGRWPNARD